MERRLRGILDEGIIALLRYRPFDRIVGYLAYSRRRRTRRVVESRLAAEGRYPDEVVRSIRC